MPRRSVLRLAAASVVSVAVVLVVIAALVGVRRPASQGELIVAQDVPVDVQAELDVTWSRFGDAFGARRHCYRDVSVVLVRDVEGGDARYVSRGATIEIEIPTTPARFRESLAHELGHHVERTCEDFAELQRAMMVTLGAPSQGWGEGASWEQTPAEIWAEGAVALVNGERLLHGDDMPIDPSVTELIEAWARGEAVDPLSR